jgi:hypothetical protein
MAEARGLAGKGLRGQIGKELVFKKYGKKTIVTRYPDMSKVKPSTLQKKGRKRFAEAVAYARTILHTPRLKAAYQKKVRKGQDVYHYALQEFLKKGA